jgi:hypothetical protein
MPRPKGKPKTGGRKKGSANKVGANVRALAQRYTEEAIETLAKIMRDKSAPPQARAMAADRLLDRAHGKAPQAIVGDPAKPLQSNAKIEMVIVDPKPTIDRPPEETREQWLARRAKELGLDASNQGRPN